MIANRKPDTPTRFKIAAASYSPYEMIQGGGSEYELLKRAGTTQGGERRPATEVLARDARCSRA
jgi:hypothetical protein